MAIDPITLEVLRNRFDNIADEMEMVQIRTAYSMIMREGGDCSAAIFNTQGEAIAEAIALPMHLGVMVPAVKACLETFPVPTMKDGDVYTMNDPYSGGTHLPDLFVILPTFYEGDVIALCTSLAHHQDIGGKTPGSMPPDATDIFQEGLIIPPLKLYDEGKPNETLFTMIRKNTRYPEEYIADLRAQLAAVYGARNRLVRVCDEYGRDTILESFGELLDYTERRVRKEIENMPDGSYTWVDYCDNDGVDLYRRLKCQATVTVKGTDLIVDFTGTDPQSKGPANISPTDAASATKFVIKAVTDPTIPSNSGSIRPITLILPPGTLVNPKHPAPVCIRQHTLLRLADALMGAMVKAMPGKVPAPGSTTIMVAGIGGLDPLTGKYYGCTIANLGSCGGRPSKDGIDGQDTFQINSILVPAEALESEYPVRVVRNSLQSDSAGAGEYRGGLALERVVQIMRGEATVSLRSERHSTRPWGLFGGLPGGLAKAFVLRKNGESNEILSRGVFNMEEGDQLYLLTSGGGGYGDPLQRSLERVVNDVVDKKVSIESARRAYGVVIDEATMRADVAKTEELRKRMAEERGAITWTYDRGELGRE